MSNPILHSFEIATARCEDLTPLVYRRLFRAHPEAEAMFRRDGGDLVKGSMLAFTIDAILDLAGERRGLFRMIECEIVSHDAYGTPPDLFNAFFGIIAETLRELLGADWTTAIEEAWQTRSRWSSHRMPQRNKERRPPALSSPSKLRFAPFS